MPDYAAIFNARGHSYNEASAQSPFARENERATLLDWLHPQAGQIIGDAPAGGGYVAEGIRRRFGAAVTVVCIEPSQNFAAAIPAGFQVLNAALSAVPLPSGYFDSIASLAGLHHFEDKSPIFREWRRLIKPHGQLVAADVQAATGTANFLNVFVHEFTNGGHVGHFLRPGDFTSDLTTAGFEEVREELVTVPWLFPDENAMSAFCAKLFSIESASPGQVLDALHTHIGLNRAPNGGVQMQWQLRYAYGRRAASQA